MAANFSARSVSRGRDYVRNSLFLSRCSVLSRSDILFRAQAEAVLNDLYLLVETMFPVDEMLL